MDSDNDNSCDLRTLIESGDFKNSINMTTNPNNSINTTTSAEYSPKKRKSFDSDDDNSPSYYLKTFSELPLEHQLEFIDLKSLRAFFHPPQKKFRNVFLKRKPVVATQFNPFSPSHTRRMMCHASNKWFTRHKYDNIRKLSATSVNVNLPTNKKVGLVYDKRMCLHIGPDSHPEAPIRIQGIWNKLVSSKIAHQCQIVPARSASKDELLLIHSEKHIEDVIYHRWIVGDNFGCSNTIQAALLSAGSIVSLTEKVVTGQLNSGYAIVRPPGHHAERNQIMGFCFFNNIALGAAYAINKLGLKKVAIIDWDVHHGNGTQDIFEDDDRVLYISMHNSVEGYFPNTGKIEDIGKGKGTGYSINIPWTSLDMGNPEYYIAWMNIVLPILKDFEPELVMVSAGFDATIGDPLGGMCLTPDFYAWMTRQLLKVANGKLVLVLEGGYNVNVISDCSIFCIRELLYPQKDIPFDYTDTSTRYRIRHAKTIIYKLLLLLHQYWPSLKQSSLYEEALTANLNEEFSSDELDNSEWMQEIGKTKQISDSITDYYLLTGKKPPDRFLLADMTRRLSSCTSLEESINELESEDWMNLLQLLYLRNPQFFDSITNQ